LEQQHPAGVKIRRGFCFLILGCFISAAKRHIAKEAGLMYQPSEEDMYGLHVFMFVIKLQQKITLILLQPFKFETNPSQAA
jgi:hypothetical protein